MSEMKGGTRNYTLVRSEPGETYRWCCTTCSAHLRSRHEVKVHWGSHNVGHSLYRKITTGRIYHQTVEGLYQRRSLQGAEEPPDNCEGAQMAPSWAFEVGDRVLLSLPTRGRNAPGEVVARGILAGTRTYLVITARTASPLHLVAEALLLPIDRPADGRNGR